MGDFRASAVRGSSAAPTAASSKWRSTS